MSREERHLATGGAELGFGFGFVFVFVFGFGFGFGFRFGFGFGFRLGLGFGLGVHLATGGARLKNSALLAYCAGNWHRCAEGRRIEAEGCGSMLPRQKSWPSTTAAWLPGLPSGVRPSPCRTLSAALSASAPRASSLGARAKPDAT